MFGLTEEKNFDVWYFTPTGRRKYKGFDTIEEVTQWCKTNKKRVRLHSGSSQVLEIMKSI